ncbi:MAG: hypothetical protein A2W93_12070 [Bacteroidetes bacterium GWF2_43_63]|nr:MAG: hypothetical protein A2W94_11570 [Bacteroidetes bacterium GWE2_42_42]OFY56360.1 MAG: hypothetical protein A2W93_12070 [Bacteroidetes bacterium GWF2_43_63]HBG69677.1 hypothetical protein [Bacteroidales bacterium]HCB61944.1 hypothetical protein [Bacteroidales bacterium]HCY42277.1 hypothetical protein [Prolixibacteraceae bacterium]
MNNLNNKIRERIKEICDSFSFFIEESNENSYRIFTGEIDGVTLFLNFNEDKLSFYFLVRTSDVVYSGDRSDLHIVISLMLASFLKIKANISCSIFDIAHPLIDDEIWGRYIYPSQYEDSSINILDFIENLFSMLLEWRYSFWMLIGCPCQKCMEEENLINERDYYSESNLIGYTATITRYNAGSRIRPSYSFVYDIDNDITIIKSKSLIDYLKRLMTLFDYNPQKIRGINGDIYIDSTTYNFASHSALNEIANILTSIDRFQRIDVDSLIVIENFVISIGEDYIIAKSLSSGLDAFKLEKEFIRERHNLEASILFPIPLFEWIENPCPAQFELLIKSLLERDVKVKRVRIASPTNQGDNGRDLIIDWEIVEKNQTFNETKPPSRILKIVGQCKASNTTIGKSKVQDIKDTIEYHDATGFFLAVSTQITNPLTEALEKLNRKQLWTDWWNRDDIEFRLNQNQDLIPKFDKVVKIKNTIKFINE